MVESELRKFTIYYRKEEDGGYSGRCVELPAAISQGDTWEEFQANMREAILLVLEHMESKIKKKEEENRITLEVTVQ